MLESCCNLGETRAKQLPSIGCTVTNSSIDQFSTNSPYREQCKIVMEICCIREHTKQNCNSGKQLAKLREQCTATHRVSSTNVAKDVVHDCCLACQLGTLAAEQNFPCAFNVHGTFGLGHPWEDVYYDCCQSNAKNERSGSFTKRIGKFHPL